MIYIVVGGAVSLLLTVVAGIFPKLKFLPLGGSSIAELGIVLGSSVAIQTLADHLAK